MDDIQLQHDCGVSLSAGDHETYSTERERVMWEGTAYRFHGTCPACGGTLDPDEDVVKVSGR